MSEQGGHDHSGEERIVQESDPDLPTYLETKAPKEENIGFPREDYGMH